MLKINPKDLSQKETHKILSGTIAPRPVAFVTTLNLDKTINGAPFSFFSILTPNPPLISLSVLREDNKMKDTAINIIREKEFVVHVMTQENVEKFNMAAARLPYGISEIDLANLTPINSTNIKTPGVKEGSVRFEVLLENHLELGDNGIISADFFIGRVSLIHLREDIYQNTYINYENLKPIGRLAGNKFVKVIDLYSLDRPK